LPFGIPKTDKERRETHKMVYGNTRIPKKRKGKNLRYFRQIIANKT